MTMNQLQPDQLRVKFKPRKINLEPRDILNLSNLADGEIIEDPTGRHQPGVSFVINHGDIGSVKFPSIMFPSPNPVEFYLFSTLSNLENIRKLETDVVKDPKKVNALLLQEFQFCIFAVSSLEAFINQIIPAGYSYTDKKGIIFTKEQIENTWSIEDKIKKVITDITGVAVAADSNKWGVLISLVNLRNDIIHLKTTHPEVSDFRSYQNLYKRLLDHDYENSFSVLKDIITMLA